MIKICPVCNSEFETTTAKKTCSEKCHSENKRIKMREFLAAHPGYMKKYYHEHYSPKNRKQKAIHDEVVKTVTREIEKEKKIKQQEEKTILESFIDVHGQKMKVYHCIKMRLKATKLPCGLRRECYAFKCPHAPKEEGLPKKHWAHGNNIG